MYIKRRKLLRITTVWRWGVEFCVTEVNPSILGLFTCDWQGSGQGNGNFSFRLIRLEFVSSAMVGGVNSCCYVEWHRVTDCIVVLFLGPRGDPLWLWGRSGGHKLFVTVYTNYFTSIHLISYQSVWKQYEWYSRGGGEGWWIIFISSAISMYRKQI
jgi:hypothetical protein